MVCSHGVSNSGGRPGNEDSFLADDELRLFVVADGMGGHLAGEVASRLSVNAIENFIRRSEDADDLSWPCGIDDTLTFEGNRLRTAIHLANRRVHREAESREDYTGMGSTVACALIRGRQLTIGHVGDSRIYLMARGTVRQLTADDTWAAALAANGTADPATLATHPMRHVLTSALGVGEQVQIHVADLEIGDGDSVLICSDGVHDVLDEAGIAALAMRDGEPPALSQAIVAAALAAGSRDNVTAVVVRVSGDGDHD
jgi:protein phosphatase